jgi:hypothetical protein
MMAARSAIDERDAFGLLIDPVSAGLAHLKRRGPLWGDRATWAELLIAVGAFHARWSSPCRAAGWSDVQLFGLDPDAPRNRLSLMGGAFLASSPGRQVLGVDARRIALITRTGAKLSVYRPAGGGVLAWELCGAGK